MVEWVRSAGAALTVDGDTGVKGYVTVADATPFYPGALAWLSNTAGSQRCVITDIVSSANRIGIRFLPESAIYPLAGGSAGAATPSYGRSSCAAYTVGTSSRLDMEDQAVRVQQPFNAWPSF